MQLIIKVNRQGEHVKVLFYTEHMPNTTAPHNGMLTFRQKEWDFFKSLLLGGELQTVAHEASVALQERIDSMYADHYCRECGMADTEEHDDSCTVGRDEVLSNRLRRLSRSAHVILVDDEE